MLVPGANFRRVFRKDFHQMERPLAVIVPREGEPVAVVPHLEMGSFQPIGFPGQVFAWRDEAGYMDAFMAAGQALPQLRQGARIGVEGQRMRVFDLFALQKALPGAEFIDVMPKSQRSACTRRRKRSHSSARPSRSPRQRSRPRWAKSPSA